jgi:ribosomal protein L35AE/L33A
MDIHSSAVWGEVLNYESTEKKDYDDAKILKEKGENQKSTGAALLAVGVVVFVLRFTGRPSAKEV